MMVRKKILSIILSATLIFSSSSLLALTADMDGMEPLELHSNEFYMNQSNSIKIYNDLLVAMKSDAYSISPATVDYPDYYGGAYINEQTGQLTILLTDMKAEVENEVSLISGTDDGLIYQECNVSYNDIVETIDLLTENIAYFDELGIYIDGICDDILNGQVVVSVQDLNQEKENAISKFAGCDFLRFENSVGVSTEESFGGGDTITSLDNGAKSTICYAAERNN